MWALPCSLDSALFFYSPAPLHAKQQSLLQKKYYVQTVPLGTERNGLGGKPPSPADWESGHVPDIIFCGNNPFPMAA